MRGKNDLRPFDQISSVLRQVADCSRRIGDQCPLGPEEMVDWRYVLHQLDHAAKFLDSARGVAQCLADAEKKVKEETTREELPTAEPLPLPIGEEVDRD